jgi:hypothetical protein
MRRMTRPDRGATRVAAAPALGGTSTSVQITASADGVFRMLGAGSSWRELDNNPATVQIVASNGT